MGGNGSSSKKKSGGGGGGVSSSEAAYNEFEDRTVRLRDKWGDYTGETHSGKVGADGDTLISVERSSNGEYVVGYGDVQRGIIAENRGLSKSEAYKRALKALRGKR